MKKNIMLLLLLFVTSLVMAQNVEDVLGVSKLKFNGTKYLLGYSVHNSTHYLQEYFPKGETPDRYTDMFTISVHISPELTPQKAIEAKAIELELRKSEKKDVWNWEIYNNSDESEYMIDFICCSGSAEKLDFIEFDVHRYRTIEVNGQNALQLMFYTHRVYGDDIIPFLEEKFSTLRMETINALTKFDIDCKVR